MQKVRHSHFDTTTKPEDLPDRDLTKSEYAALVGSHIETIRNHCLDGTIKGAYKQMTGKQEIWMIPRVHARQAICHRSNRQYIAYANVPVPHFSYLMYRMIRARTKKERAAVQDTNDQYRLPRLPRAALDEAWDTLTRMASPPLRRALNGRRELSRVKGFNNWVTSLGIAALFENGPAPCERLLLDHSKAREEIEILMSGRVALEEIRDFVKAERNKYYTVDELSYFQRYFYNAIEFTDADFMRYIALVDDPTERGKKMNAWDNPSEAWAQVGVSSSVDYINSFGLSATLAQRKIQEALHDPSVPLDQALKAAKMLLDSHKGTINELKLRKQEESEAIQEASADMDDNVDLVETKETPPTFDELNQELPAAHVSGDEGQAKAG